MRAVGRGSRCDEFRGECTIPMRDRKVKTIAWYVNAASPRSSSRARRSTLDGWSEAIRVARRRRPPRRVPPHEGRRLREHRWVGRRAGPTISRRRSVRGAPDASAEHLRALPQPGRSVARTIRCGACERPAASRAATRRPSLQLHQPHQRAAGRSRRGASWWTREDPAHRREHRRQREPVGRRARSRSGRRWSISSASSTARSTRTTLHRRSERHRLGARRTAAAARWMRGTAMSAEEIASRMSAFDPKALAPSRLAERREAKTASRPPAARARRAAGARSTAAGSGPATARSPRGSVASARHGDRSDMVIARSWRKPRASIRRSRSPQQAIQRARRPSASIESRRAHAPATPRDTSRALEAARLPRSRPPSPTTCWVWRSRGNAISGADPKDPAGRADATRRRSTSGRASNIRTACFAHELGHSMGLRHNFAATFDSLNYRHAVLAAPHEATARSRPPCAGREHRRHELHRPALEGSASPRRRSTATSAATRRRA